MIKLKKYLPHSGTETVLEHQLPNGVSKAQKIFLYTNLDYAGSQPTSRTA